MTLQISREQELLAKIEKLEVELATKKGLPHIYSFPWYPWAREFFESANKINLLTAANQVSKSSTQIRKCITWATDKTLWTKLWNHDPIQFWYLYPTSKQVNTEFETKWKLFLPKGEFKDDPIYGYQVEKYHGDIVALHFHSGVHVYFKTYAQNVSSLQSGTCDAIFCDEELPELLFPELIFRISASDGYFHMVFTATLGQDFWRRAMEVADLREGETEVLPDAYKKCVSLFECQKYEDGSSSHWTDEKIHLIEARCPTHADVLKRVFGRFVVDKSFLKYPQFDYKRHMKPSHPLPPNWLVYGGADVGGGNKGDDKGHLSAILFVAVNPEMTQGRVFLGWRGDGESTTAGDVVEKFIEMKKERGLKPVRQMYDWGSADFYKIATRLGESFEKAEKGHDLGEDTVNSLFKLDMLYIYQTPELEKLAAELIRLKKNPSLKKDDDLSDTLRYVVNSIPWNWALGVGINDDKDTPLVQVKNLNTMEAQIEERRKGFEINKENDPFGIEAELREWNEAYGE